MRLNSKKIAIVFEIESDSPWLLNMLDNENLLTDLAERAMREFVHDLRKMNGFGNSNAAPKLLSAYIVGGIGGGKEEGESTNL